MRRDTQRWGGGEEGGVKQTVIGITIQKRADVEGRECVLSHSEGVGLVIVEGGGNGWSFRSPDPPAEKGRVALGMRVLGLWGRCP